MWVTEIRPSRISHNLRHKKPAICRFKGLLPSFPPATRSLGVCVRIYGTCVAFFVVFSSLLASAGTRSGPPPRWQRRPQTTPARRTALPRRPMATSAPTNISKVPTRSLLYPGSTAKIYAHFMPWFGFGDHMNVGYISSDTLQVQKQVNDMVSRGPRWRHHRLVRPRHIQQALCFLRPGDAILHAPV